ncbi:tetratricopeptide repeat protein [Leadbettera azotonutricia]|uniref:Tetratricopeptide repeat protein n=1 Tax=Leadbettera azotonutricia (strain ATCC BAA-888 / DSM 13862 / ZAS-9) TaxID=545695 RepID=F5YC41_LEAAZ|nr:tetratricopeptide repeat protein [Leadbettera azotonutricia]AEF82179.1 tetratricopeptide repeat protein [Leadbettera azotonutricia ZAS-9]
MSGETTIEGLLQKAYNSLKDAGADTALRFLQEALKEDYEHQEVLFALKCLTWWLDKLKRLEDFRSPYEKGGYILAQWKIFQVFQERISEAAGSSFDSCQFAVRHYVFSLALSSFGEALGESQQDPEVMLQVGRCYKGVGNYEEAVKYLELAARAKREDSGALAEMADTKALLGDSRAAKVLFREAFFLNPQGIDLQSMESEMILRLKEKTAELGYGGQELAEWIPVYGCLWGVFSIKRELKPVELGGLKQSILTLENDLRGSSDAGILKPRLINRYFRLIDHYENVRDNSEAVEETMLKIKFIDPAIYEQYRN